jgi:Reverse transcriptase (RNA-dependent DNA polymerase)
MFNFKTKRIIHSRDVVWLRKRYKNWMITNVPSKEEYDDNDDDDDDGYVHIIATFNQEANNHEGVHVIQDKDQNIKGKVYWQLKRLESSFNPEASKILKDIEQGRDIILDQGNIALFSGNIQDEPTTFDQAWNHADPKDRDNWRFVIKKVFNDMESKKVWEIMKKEDFPEWRRTVKNKWIFKIKRNVIFIARLVACGYSQVLGIDFTEYFASVINNVSFRIMPVSKLIWDLQASIIDV